ncbi:MAG: hypothetical protein JNL58_25870 [Planctomyces sp.]|nr:hypothetical protein [Planctomyces sp.]
MYLVSFLRNLFATGELLMPAAKIPPTAMLPQAMSPKDPPSEESPHKGPPGTTAQSFELSWDADAPELPARREATEKPAVTVEGVLFEAERIWRASLPDDLPAFDVRSAKQAAEVVFAVCQSLADASFRAVDVQRVIDECGLKPSTDPSVIYSADLLFRFLPQLEERAGRLSDSELKDVIRQLCTAWPFSSVGVNELTHAVLCDAIRQGGLWTEFTDRVFATRDKHWMMDSFVKIELKSSLGHYPELDPTLFEILKPKVDTDPE